MHPTLEQKQRRRYRAEWLLLVAVVLAIGALFGYMLLRERSGIERNESDRLQVQARVIDENLVQHLNGIGNALLGVRSDFFSQQTERRAYSPRRLRALTDAVPGIDAMLVLNGAGIVVAADRGEPLDEDHAARDYFTAVREHPEAHRLYVSRPFKLATGRLQVNVSLALISPQGGFAGVVTAGLDLAFFDVLQRSVRYAPDMRTAVLSGDGIAFLNSPSDLGGLGLETARAGSFFMRHRDSGRAATLLSGSLPASSEERMVATRTVLGARLPVDKPLVIHVSRELGALYGPWRSQAQIAGGLFVLLAAGAMALLHAAQARRRQYERLSFAALREREEAAARLRAITENMPARIAHFDRDARYLFANVGVEDDIGIDRSTLVGRRLREVRGEAVYAVLEPHVQAVLAGRAVVFETTRRDGAELRHLQQSFVPDFGPDGAVRGFYSLSFDISERKQAELQQARSEERIRSILTHAPDAYIGLDEHGAVTEWNRQAELTFGWPRGEALGRRLADLIIPPAQRAAHHAGMQHFRRTGLGPVIDRRIEVTALCRDGREIPIEMSVSAMRHGGAFIANAFLRDISDRRLAQANLAWSEQRLRSITDNVPVLIAYIDREHRMTFANGTFKTWLGIDPQQVVGRPLAEVIGRALYVQRRDALERALGGERTSFETHARSRGERCCLRTICVPDVQDGRVMGVYALSTDITAMKQVERRLEGLARIDTLTGLPNRRRFDEKLPEAIARSRRVGLPMALLYLDIDHFKLINDSEGHAVGDAVLIEFARRLRACVRTTDSVARLAGDEFVIILEGLHNEAEASRVAAKIGEALKRPFALDGATIDVTSSIGIAFLDGEDAEQEELVLKADKALYRAKRAGRAGYVLSTFGGLPSGARRH